MIVLFFFFSQLKNRICDWSVNVEQIHLEYVVKYFTWIVGFDLPVFLSVFYVCSCDILIYIYFFL